MRIRADAQDAMSVVVMDRKDQRPGESDGEFFHRLEKENDVAHYFILLPPNCKVLGTVFEGGMLERDFHWGAHPRITLFLHASIAHCTPGTGDVEFVETGKRTHYLESVARRADDNVFWQDVEELERKVIKRTRALWSGL